MKKKRALCIGINDYPGTNNDLNGCVNDAQDWAELFSRGGYEVTLLLDSMATGQAIRDGMRAIVQTTGWGDRGVVTYSGHGTNLRDVSGDEADGRDEALVPYDFQNGVILDDELYDIFGYKRFGAKVFFISDSCFSGTINRFFDPGARTPKPRYMPPQLIGLDPRPSDLPRDRAPRKSPVTTLTGCAENEVSYDCWFGSRANGALTRTAIDSYNLMKGTSANFTLIQWYADLKGRMTYDQHPQFLPGTPTARYWRASQ